MASTAKTAVACMALASALFAATSLIAKILGQPSDVASALPPFMISAGRFGFAFCTLLVVLILRPTLRPAFRDVHWVWHLARSACGWLGVTCMFTAVARMPMAEASAISFLNPIFTMGLAVLVLGENLTLRKILAAAMALIGAVLIIRPGAEAIQPAALFALGSAAFMGIEGLFIKRLSDAEPGMQILVINNAMGATIALTAASFVWQMPSLTQWAFMVALGTVMVSGQSLFIQALKRAEVGAVLPVFYSVLVFAALYDLALFQVVPSGAAIIGAAFIVSGALILALRR